MLQVIYRQTSKSSCVWIVDTLDSKTLNKIELLFVVGAISYGLRVDQGAWN